MAHPNKTKGDRAERAVRDYLRSNGFPRTERTRAGYTRDAGDLHPCQGLTVQVKDRAAYAWPEWFRQLREQRAEAKADHAVLVLKRRGLGDPGEWLAVMPLSEMTRLLKAAGYGLLHDSAELWPDSPGGKSLNGSENHEMIDPLRAARHET
ncbi:hypothetical protein [Williamsia sp. DF01-3]|uniref:hypothetical protein n=1 Tax=Williamsia sp. DF01-3 TaxID=2934157 RepID=UPI001FF47F5B|nr:hypothetical protein [Williamsia sp. DF01-3]MCK0516978.1 hypothetical protein [Williamsia sp. DF01-3]